MDGAGVWSLWCELGERSGSCPALRGVPSAGGSGELHAWKWPAPSNTVALLEGSRPHLYLHSRQASLSVRAVGAAGSLNFTVTPTCGQLWELMRAEMSVPPAELLKLTELAPPLSCLCLVDPANSGSCPHI